MSTGDFTAQLGNSSNPGVLPLSERLERIRPGRNPYVTGTSLAANSPVFFGRAEALHEILGVLRQPEKPGCVSLLGERRIGKSSLLNQIFQALASEPGLVSIHATAQNWNRESQQLFYSRLHRAVAEAVGTESDEDIGDYPGFRDFIRRLVQAQGYRFVLVIDEFEEMANNDHFDADFFSNLRALGERPEYRFGYLISSKRPLKELCREHRVESSSFWNVFGLKKILGLLPEQESRDLVAEPLRRSLPSAGQSDPRRLWRDEIEPLAGCHPALIQMTAAAHWSALDGGYMSDPLAIATSLHDHLEDLWFRRSREEWSVLIRAAAGRPLRHDPLTADLIQRGLITRRGELFSGFFQDVIKENFPEGKGIAEALKDLEKGTEQANKLFESLEKLARTAGKVYRAFKHPDENSEEKSGS